MASINFFCDFISFNVPQPIITRRWLKLTAHKEQRQIKELNYIFTSDRRLLEINKQYLNHSTFTDIITFDNSEKPTAIEGDIFISIDRVKDNSLTFQVPFEVELARVMVHGLLHLIGYKDKNNEQKAVMRKKEDTYLSLRKFHVKH